jgi:hypothetical protein
MWKESTSGNSVHKSRDSLKEIATRFHHPFRELIIAHLMGNVTQPLQSHPGKQVALGFGQ